MGRVGDEGAVDKMVHSGAICALFYRATHRQRIVIARYMLRSGVCLSVCLSVTRSRGGFINAAEYIITQSTEN